MSKSVWAWIAGGAVFAAIFGIWLWQLPGIVGYASGGRDIGLANIFSSVKETKEALAPDFVRLQKQLDQKLGNMSQTVAAIALQARALDEVKKKIEIDAAKKKIEAALIKSQEPMPTGRQAISNSQ